ncbi:MAG: DUF1156 domain-containing protein [Desulfobacterales bacterium]|nr:DUF1156 domain-containing protein [Desulfobacterales bacterium]
MEYPKKLIEVALPLDDINAAAEIEKSPFTRKHPRSLHIWWARRPLAAARAVLFAQLVNDPGGKRGYGAYKWQTKKDAQKERERLFQIIRDLVKWENTNNEEVLKRAREEIRKSWCETCEITGDDPEKMPPFLDPFAGGGSIPLEAQRLSLEAHASDVNPVAVMINKAMIEIPPKFAGKKPICPLHPEDLKQRTMPENDWSGAKGLAEDIRRYGFWMQEEAWKRIGHLYPNIDLPEEYGRGKASVIAWLWARTVKSPNPAYNHVNIPLVRSFILSNKKGKESYVEPVITGDSYHFEIRTGKQPKEAILRTVERTGATCILSQTPLPFSYIRSEAKAGRIKSKMMAIIVEGKKGRIYLAPVKDMEEIAYSAKPENIPKTQLPEKALGFRVQEYGMLKHSDLFTSRQLVALTTFSDLVQEAREKVIHDAKEKGWNDDGKGLNEGGIDATAYGDAVAVYLSLATSRWADMSNTICTWNATNQNVRALFTRQAIPMSWDYAELSPFSKIGSWFSTVETISILFQNLCSSPNGHIIQADATHINPKYLNYIISSDPPYYDNIGYADLSDFFYVWLRRSLKNIYPDIFSTMLVPKEPELVATPYRHGTKEKAELYFMEGMTKAIQNMSISCHSAYPVTIYYAFKQSETAETGTSSTGWETFLSAVIKSGFSITGTWPMRTERIARSVNIGTNALASSIILVCRKRATENNTISRKQFLRELEETLPEALDDMIGGKEGASPIAPVDLAQAAIGPGMAVFSKYASVLEADGSPMTVHNALILINKAIDEYFTHAESDMEAETRFCVDWFQQYGFKEGPFGEADVLARAKGTTVDSIQNSGVIKSGGGKVRLLKISEYSSSWNPKKDPRIPVWEACHNMCRALTESEIEAGTLLAKIFEKMESIRQLAYRLYTLCERKGWAEDARRYNELITSWNGIVKVSQDVGITGTQRSLFKDL